MKFSKIFAFGFCFGLLALTASATAEARAHIGLSFGGAVVAQRPCVTPVYVAAPCQPVIVAPQPYCERVYVASRPSQPVYLYPAYPVYRERTVVYPRSFFSFGFWR